MQTKKKKGEIQVDRWTKRERKTNRGSTLQMEKKEKFRQTNKEKETVTKILRLGL